MTWLFNRRSLLAAVLMFVVALPLAAESLPSIAANDNRTPAGELRQGALVMRLEIREGNWHPFREDGESIPVYAFGEAGKPLQIPGPLIRVPQGTAIDISLRNDLRVSATLHGLHQRPGDDNDIITIQPGETQRVRFLAGAPGTYLYRATTPDGRQGNFRVKDSMLGGALVVDQPGSPANDRIFVFERWTGATRTAINGKSWPYTERLTYGVGETVHWRLVNASDLSHPMHLHGTHFSVDATGDGEHYQTYAAAARQMMFTYLVDVDGTFEMSWVPKQPGRWLYHCHRLPHMRLPVPLNSNEATEEHDHGNPPADPESAGMGGMILGITVTGNSDEAAKSAWKAERKLELIIGPRKSDPRVYELALNESGQTTSKGRVGEGNAGVSPNVIGPPIVLVQNQPVEIEVVNQIKEATSIHWHGMELESYYDGVPEWGGIGEKKTPAVSPGQTFVAKMTPPRAGTFIYHSHWHDDAQLSSGIDGPLIVMPPGQTYDSATDKVFLFGTGPAQPFGAALLLNGTPQPTQMQLKTGTKYRFRLINITAAFGVLRVSLRQAGVPVQWRNIAKDAVEVPAAAAKWKPADQAIGIGETYDFEYEATVPQELALEGLSPNDGRRAIQALVFTDPPAE